jgi:putative component of membrane protein insertase Oxa1/YidC/SpoIIIJ protein YidD
MKTMKKISFRKSNRLCLCRFWGLGGVTPISKISFRKSNRLCLCRFWGFGGVTPISRKRTKRNKEKDNVKNYRKQEFARERLVLCGGY